MTSLSKAGQERAELSRINERYSTLRTLLRVGGAVLAIMYISQALEKFAGQDTSLTAALSLAADLKLTIAVALTGAATAWAVVERVLRQRKTASLQDRIRELEVRLDPHRSTSGLTTKGKTNPKDKVR